MKVVVAEKLASTGLDMLRNAGHEVVDLTGSPREKLLAALPGADALLVRSATKVDAAHLESAPVTGRSS